MIGRKGTGKSTIIARLQHEYRKSSDKLSLYIDVKSIFEQSRTFTYDASQYRNLISTSDLESYLIYKTFLKEIIEQIKDEVKTNTLKFVLAKVSSIFGLDKKTFERELDEIFDEIEKDEYIDIQILKERSVSQSKNQNQEAKYADESSGKIGLSSTAINGEIAGKATNSFTEGSNKNLEEKYSEILLKCFNPNLILSNIRSLLSKIGVKYVVICLDDFSEIEERAMRVFVDNIISPLNNWSEEYFKFKIAAYPGRFYLGDIDPQKIEQIRLDYYDLYHARKVTDMQAEAQKSVNNLLTSRIKYFCKNKPDYFFDTSKATLDEYYKLLFEITSSVPRYVGSTSFGMPSKLALLRIQE